MPSVLGGAVAQAAADPGLRARLLKGLWIELKRFSAPHIVSVELSRIAGLGKITVDGHVMRHSPLVLCALARCSLADDDLRVGTFRGDTSWLLAHNLPQARILTLDLPGPEAAQHAGSRSRMSTSTSTRGSAARASATRRRPPHHPACRRLRDVRLLAIPRTIDLVYIDASHSYSYVKADTEAALAMLSPAGTIIWDDYTYYPGSTRTSTSSPPRSTVLSTTFSAPAWPCIQPSDLLTVGSLATAVGEEA